MGWRSGHSRCSVTSLPPGCRFSCPGGGLVPRESKIGVRSSANDTLSSVYFQGDQSCPLCPLGLVFPVKQGARVDVVQTRLQAPFLAWVLRGTLGPSSDWSLGASVCPPEKWACGQ